MDDMFVEPILELVRTYEIDFINQADMLLQSLDVSWAQLGIQLNEAERWRDLEPVRAAITKLLTARTGKSFTFPNLQWVDVSTAKSEYVLRRFTRTLEQFHKWADAGDFPDGFSKEEMYHFMGYGKAMEQLAWYYNQGDVRTTTFYASSTFFGIGRLLYCWHSDDNWYVFQFHLDGRDIIEVRDLNKAKHPTDKKFFKRAGSGLELKSAFK